MKCHHCGAEVLVEAVYCHRCGSRIPTDLAIHPETSEPLRAEPQPVTEDPPDAAPDAAAPAPVAVAEPPTAEQSSDSLPAPDEAHDPFEELWEGVYSAKAMHSAWSFCTVTSLVVLALTYKFLPRTATVWTVALGGLGLLWVYQLLVLVRRRISLRYAVTPQAVVREAGLWRRTYERAELADVEELSTEQSVVERLLGVGDLHVKLAGERRELVLQGVDGVQQLARRIDDLRRAARPPEDVNAQSA